MKADINPPLVEDIAIAVIKESNENQVVWNVYLLNLKDQLIEGVLVTSKGYGEQAGEKISTSILRHFLDTIPPKSFCKIESIKEDLLGLSNEFWVSFYLNGLMYDKKYVFVAEAISEENFTLVPVLGKKGVMIK